MSVTEIPYFGGDFWPSVIEENIKKLDQEAKERKELEQASGEVGGGVCGGGEVSKGKLPGKSVNEQILLISTDKFISVL